MNFTSLKNFLLNSKFNYVDFALFPYSDPHWRYKMYEFRTNKSDDTFRVLVHKGIFKGNVNVFKNDSLVWMNTNLIYKWCILSYIKKAFNNYFNETIEKWNNK